LQNFVIDPAEMAKNEIDLQKIFKVINSATLCQGYVPDQTADINSLFIHACTEDQIENIINKFFNGDRKSVTVLQLNKKILENHEFKIVYESNPGSTSGIKYWHLYRKNLSDKIPLDAIDEII
jgi:uncharacterized protein (DUF952 family)